MPILKFLYCCFIFSDILYCELLGQNILMKYVSLFSIFILLSLCEVKSDEISLPIIGDTLSGVVSNQQEIRMGQAWLKMFRSQVKELNDPLIKSYVENLIYNLATFSELSNPKLEIVIVPNETINAFAVPGGVIGLHTGLFDYAETEDQFASVMAHELAHLSQRHFARRIEKSKDNSITGLASLLAGLVLASTLGGDAAMAAITAGQAYSAENQLRYSRSNEKEADRVGLDTMKKAGRDPRASAQMFEIMLKQVRHFGDRPPEFLLTHPVTENRLADAKARTLSEPRKFFSKSTKYQIIKARAKVLTSKDLTNLESLYRNAIKTSRDKSFGAQYGLSLVLSKLNRHSEARFIMDQILNARSEKIALVYSDIELDLNASRITVAFDKIKNALKKYPNNVALLSLRAEAFWETEQYQNAALDFRKLVIDRPNEPFYWYQLAEIEGLAGNILNVHLARAEYFIRVGAFDNAEEQLATAKTISGADFKTAAVVRQRLTDVEKMRENAEKM